MRKIDIAHSGQTVVEALEQLIVAIKQARRMKEDAVLVVHGFGASGVGGVIKAAVMAELPRLAGIYGFEAFTSDSARARLPPHVDSYARRINPGSSLLVFRRARADKEPERDFRPNFRNLKKVRVPPPANPSGHRPAGCRHTDRQLISRGPAGNTYRCRTCGTRFLVYA